MVPELFKGVDLNMPNGKDELTESQKSDIDVIELYNKALSVDGADEVLVCYFVKDGVLMRV